MEFYTNVIFKLYGDCEYDTILGTAIASLVRKTLQSHIPHTYDKLKTDIEKWTSIGHYYDFD